MIESISSIFPFYKIILFFTTFEKEIIVNVILLIFVNAFDENSKINLYERIKIRMVKII